MKENIKAVVSPSYQAAYNKPGVCFDPEEALLEGVYTDELSAHRARKGWAAALQDNFLLTEGYDFTAKIKSFPESKRFVLICDFNTACGRYAFWRLTHAQAPDAQYLIETAHIPRVSKGVNGKSAEISKVVKKQDRAVSNRKDDNFYEDDVYPSILNDSMFPASKRKGMREIISSLWKK